MAISINSSSQQTVTAAIAINTKVSQVLDMQGGFLGGIILPAALTSTTLTFTVANAPNGTFTSLCDTSGSAISYTVAASKAIAFAKDVFAPWPYVILNFGSNEAAARSVICIIRST